jgi:hypothetical protein
MDRDGNLDDVTVSFFDCQSCGACCCNTARNRADGTREYVEVEPTDRLVREQRDLLKKLAVRNANGQWHLRLVGDDERCVALEGDVGVDVRCTIYGSRPRGCRVVQAGDDECLRARRHLALPRSVVDA